MERDLRDTPLYKEVAAYFAAIYEPGANWVSEGSTVTVSPDGRRVAFTGTVFHDLQSAPVTRVCLVDLASGEMRQVAAAANGDRLPRWSPDGRKLAFLSDRAAAGNFQLYLLQADGSGAATAVKIILEGNSLFVCDRPRRAERLRFDCHGSAGGKPGLCASWQVA